MIINRATINISIEIFVCEYKFLKHLGKLLRVGLLGHMGSVYEKKTAKLFSKTDSTIWHYLNNVLHFAFWGCWKSIMLQHLQEHFTNSWDPTSWGTWFFRSDLWLGLIFFFVSVGRYQKNCIMKRHLTLMCLGTAYAWVSRGKVRHCLLFLHFQIWTDF